MNISRELMDYVADGDLHMQIASVDYSTSLRDIVTVGYMVEHHQIERG